MRGLCHTRNLPTFLKKIEEDENRSDGKEKSNEAKFYTRSMIVRGNATSS